MLVNVDQVVTTIESRRVLDGVSMRVYAGEIVALIGPNGAGKTTLLRAVLGLQSFEAGSIGLARGLRIGYVPQRFTIDPSLPMTTRRFLMLTPNAKASRMDDAVSAVGATQLLDRPLQRLSGGETQRILFARALMRDTELLVLDEPAQGVDQQGQLELHELLAETRDRTGCGVLMVSHDLHLLMPFADYVVCLNGHVCCAGTPREVEAHHGYQSLFMPQIGTIHTPAAAPSEIAVDA
ncbi:MAG: metal ABC transporter ATP-binding protein [Candidatus Poribacteria bacterium]|nr:metal ABC transporter ATP-binding protein [Candidatus Poribacteria bacterium]